MAEQKKDVALATSMNDLAAAVSQEYKDVVAGIKDKIGSGTSTAIRLTQDKHFELPNGLKSAGPLDVVIVGFTSRNVYYHQAYNPGNITPPDCFAEGDNPSAMVPSEQADMQQANNCNECPMNQFGPSGSGKPCQNQRIIAVLPAGEPDADIMTIRVSPSAIGGFDKYIAGLADKYKVPPFAVVTQVSFDSKVAYAKLQFGSPVPNPDFKQFAARADETVSLMAANFPKATEATSDNTPPPRGKGRI